MDPSLFPQRTYAPQQHQQPAFGHAHAPETAPPPEQLQIPVKMALDAFVQHSAGLTPADMGVLITHLELLMRDCSEANIQAGKNWVVNHCQNPQQLDLMSRALVAISISRVTFNDKLHIVYLVNDILSHSERKQHHWIKEALHPHLVPILRVAYYFPGSDDGQRQRVMKVLDIWRNKEFFPPYVVDTMETSVKRPPVVPPPPVGTPFPGPVVPTTLILRTILTRMANLKAVQLRNPNLYSTHMAHPHCNNHPSTSISSINSNINSNLNSNLKTLAPHHSK
ncbi:hypothetical protein EC968_001109 [Mortierella alpina]|nr:hypothetical protein EC968_001109 [Mortierella alpina]